MTREEAIRLLSGLMFKNELKEALDMAIEALKRESVLDKIRAEIDSHCGDNRDRNDGLYIAMKIIEKYKAEGSEKE